MRPAVIFLGIALFILSLGVHIIIWRVRTPWLSSFMLVLLLLGIPAAGVLSAVAWAEQGGSLSGFRTVEWLAALLLHLSLSAAYIASYPAVRAVSPSLDILQMISSSMDGRMGRDELIRRYSEARLVTARIDDLLEYRLVVMRGGRFSLTAPARWIVLIFSAYRKLLGLSEGSG